MAEQDEMARLVEYARNADIGGDPLVVDLVQAVESQQQRIRELEQQIAELKADLTTEGQLHHDNRAKAVSLQRQLAARDAVIAKAPHADDCQCAHPDDLTGDCTCWKSVAPETVLAEHDAEKWKDPKPWWSPGMQKRYAHKLPYTGDLYRPRTRAEYEADERRNGATHE